MQVSRKFIVPLLSAILLGVAPAPVNAATTISGAVVVLPVAAPYYESAGYRLTPNKATYLATFGAGNTDALITSTGGCAVKSGQLSCYGLAGTVGDGTNRNRPLAVPITLPYGAQPVKVLAARIQNMSLYDNNGDFEYSDMHQMCVQGTSAVYCWGKNGSQNPLSPVSIFEGEARLFTGTVLQTTTGEVYHWEPTDFSVPSTSYEMVLLAGGAGELSAGDVIGVMPASAGIYSNTSNEYVDVRGQLGACVVTLGSVQCLNAPIRDAMFPEVAALYPAVTAPAELGSSTTLYGALIESSFGVCTFLDLVVSCSQDTATDQYWENDSDLEGYVRVSRPSQFAPMLTLPVGSRSPIVSTMTNWGTTFACAIHDTKGIVCALPDSADEAVDTFIRDIDGDGYASLGREYSLDCGVGFSCEFTPTKLRQSDGIITAVGTLVRTPRTSAAISGTVRFPDGLPFQGSLEWNSSDGKLRATSAIAADGSFALAARSGMGSVTLHQEWADLPATCLDGTVTSGCVSDSDVTIYLDSLAASNSVNITVPTFAGEMRTIDLRFGDGETPIADVALSVVDPEAECSSTTVSLGRMMSCAKLGRGLNQDYGSQIKTGVDGTVSIWMPTGTDSILRASAADEYGLTWTDDIVSLGDDGNTPEPFSFAGLIFAQPLGVMSVRQGSTGTVSALVSVDGIDPAYGLSAGIKPASMVATTCASERRTDATDESGLVDFSLCPAGTQLWKVYATDGSFFPSAPFPITIDPAITGLRVNGATLDAAFSGGTTTYTGRFTSSRVTFTPTKASWAGSARVTIPTCSRPSRGTRDCTMSVRVGSSTITYTFTLRR